MKRYLLIRPDEDGAPNRFLDEEELRGLLAVPSDYGIDSFLSMEAVERIGPDANYWPDASALLVEFTALLPVPATVAFRLPSKP